jgi:hypothetical protein
MGKAQAPAMSAAATQMVAYRRWARRQVMA